MLILKLEENGNLKSYMAENKAIFCDEDTYQDKLAIMCLDISKGMAYLTKLKVTN